MAFYTVFYCLPGERSARARAIFDALPATRPPAQRLPWIGFWSANQLAVGP